MTNAPPTNTDSNRPGMLRQLMGMGRPYWVVNIMEIFERLAYYGVRVVIPIYIAQADEIGGLHFTQTEKGIIFLWWAIFQSMTPLLIGGYADRYGFKKVIAASVFVKVAGYLLMATQTSFYPFLIGCCTLALGTAIFKPGIQGTISRVVKKENSSVAWGGFYMLVNIGGFLGPPVAHFLYGISWPAVFYGCAAIVSLNLLMLLTYRDVDSGSSRTETPLQVLGRTITDFCNPRLLVFVLIMSGFWLMFMQLFDMLPNFIVDWVDSSALANALGNPEFMLQRNAIRGAQISQEWMINANSGLIIVGVVYISWLVARLRRVMSISIGIVAASLGLMLAGFTTSGYFCIMGILVFSVGEMLASPKMQDYLGIIAPGGKKGLYMGYANMPQGIGWAVGSLFAGHIYDRMGDKANLAADYLANHFSMTGVDRTVAMQRLVEVTGMTHSEATELLWTTYDPYRLWYPFALIGLVAAAGMLLYARWVKKSGLADA